MTKAAAVCALMLGLGFGLPGAYGAWSYARHGEVWTFLGFPTYGDGPFERWGLPTSTALIVGFVAVCAAEVVVGVLLWRDGRRDPPAADGERVLEKSSGLLRPGAGLSEKSALIEAEKANYPVRWMCQMLDVPRSCFYAWRERARSETATAARRRQLAEQVQRVFDEQRQTAGCRRVAAHFNDEGQAVQRRPGRRHHA